MGPVSRVEFSHWPAVPAVAFWFRFLFSWLADTLALQGRYANRIKNGTFEIDGITYNTVKNENDGVDTLHGGSNGWDWVSLFCKFKMTCD